MKDLNKANHKWWETTGRIHYRRTHPPTNKTAAIKYRKIHHKLAKWSNPNK